MLLVYVRGCYEYVCLQALLIYTNITKLDFKPLIVPKQYIFGAPLVSVPCHACRVFVLRVLYFSAQLLYRIRSEDKLRKAASI